MLFLHCFHHLHHHLPPVLVHWFRHTGHWLRNVGRKKILGPIFLRLQKQTASMASRVYAFWQPLTVTDAECTLWGMHCQSGGRQLFLLKVFRVVYGWLTTVVILSPGRLWYDTTGLFREFFALCWLSSVDSKGIYLEPTSSKSTSWDKPGFFDERRSSFSFSIEAR